MRKSWQKKSGGSEIKMTDAKLLFQKVTTEYHDAAHCKADGLMHVVIRAKGRKLFDMWLSDAQVTVARRTEPAAAEVEPYSCAQCST
jgi:hypothetical protein